ncbi:neprilysin-4 isoform X1 [Nasonia vitripennis]|uniref:Uncharacterized protein n=3 Tax=Nasonia vitripennis TaxID=7425 RepID=A0A7M7HGH6_NASVI|nr:neprilysin-4 isoform X1 [Nasonia vitripennis]
MDLPNVVISSGVDYVEQRGLGYMPSDYDSSNWRFFEAVRGKRAKKHRPKRRMRFGLGSATTTAAASAVETASQISDDGGGGICPSCRLAVNKDTGRLKWCMGGNDIWRTRIRFMLLIPAVILPVTIIIIALSKSTVVGKLSMRQQYPTTSAPDDQQPNAQRLDDQRDQSFTTIQSDIEASEGSVRFLHPDVETSFLPAESLIPPQTLRRHKRDMSQVQRTSAPGTTINEAAKRQSSDDGKPHSAAAFKSELLQELSALAEGRCEDCDDTEDASSSSSSSSFEEDDEEVDPEDDDDDDDEDADVEDDETSEEEDDHNEALRQSPFDEALREHDDESLSYSKEDDESNFRAFWKGNWNEEFIRKAQAKMMLKYMDRTAEPCQDFYQYACGNWGKYNPIPDDKTGFDTFETLRESLAFVLKQLLEEPEPDDSNEAIVKAKNLFRSCMNYEILERRSERPLLELLDSLGGWPILRRDWNADRFDWIRLMARLRLYNNDILIAEWVGPDIKNSEEYVIQFDQTTLGLPTKDYFLQPANAIYLMAYKNYLITIASLLGASVKSASIQAEELIQFEIRLANITISSNERHNISDLYKRMTLRELRQMIPLIDWHRYLSIVLARRVDLSEPVVVFATKYFQDLVQLLSHTSPRTVANYLLWRFVRHRVNNLDDRFQEAKQTFYYILFGREKSPPRWKNCVVQVNANMGMAVGSIFVRKYFDEKSKNDTLYMTHEIQRAFRELLNQSSWLDPQTKLVASEKVEAMQLRIGYPDFILRGRELDERYRDVVIDPNKYFENTLNILRHLTMIEQDRLGQPVNKTLWTAAPAIVNAYYNRNKNQIMFPAGILQPPFYHRYFPRSLNYGGIGVVIGHEITHGFDNKGRLFDKDGNLHRWWSGNAIQEFDRRASCLVDQYGRFTVKEVEMSVDGVNTQGENIADNGGIKQAFRAYEKWLSQNEGTKESLPGMEANGRQLFFLNFAQVWCGAMRPEAMKNSLKTAIHSPGRYRVIGTLSNFEEFAKVFNCPLGSPMNPEKKCLVW